jgi:hypothetical protein
MMGRAKEGKQDLEKALVLARNTLNTYLEHEIKEKLNNW